MSNVILQEGATITDALSTAMTSTASQMTTAIGTVLPIALGVAGGILVITLGWKLFKRLTK